LVEINIDNFENYLSEDEKILPDFYGGEVYSFKGKIISMQCGKGDSMKIRLTDFPKKCRDLVCYPSEGRTTKDFDDFYGKEVAVKALVERKSFYQKPKLHLQEIDLFQSNLV